MTSLLPPNSTQLEKDLVTLADNRFRRYPNQLDALWNADTIPAALLPFLAWAMSLDIWDDSWGESTQRQVIKESIQWHRRKGTVWSIREVLRWFGHDNVTIEEGSANLYDGLVNYDGTATYANPESWAYYNIILNEPIDNAQALKLRAMLEKVAPKRSELVTLDYRTATIYYNGASTYDGTYNYGAA